GILSTLMSAMAKNASTPDGASALANALDNDHDGSVIDNLTDLLGGATQPQNTRATNGTGILKHVLGGKQSGAIDMISKMSGLSSGNTGNLMTMLAPMVMGMLGKEKRNQGLDGGGIADFLTSSVQSATNQRQEMSIVGKFLDQDGDGSMLDDIAGMGMNLLGKFLKK
ncbi:MAG: DUF937 domain-containing protein, partial [Bacteroidota bacterium]